MSPLTKSGFERRTFETHHYHRHCGLTGRSGKSNTRRSSRRISHDLSSGGNHEPRKQTQRPFEKATTKTHACRIPLPARSGSARRRTPAATTATTVRTAFPACIADIEPGDRASDCNGIMEPVAVWVRRGGEWAIIHRCKRCGALSSNRVAADEPDEARASIAMKPLRAAARPHRGDDRSHGRRRAAPLKRGANEGKKRAVPKRCRSAVPLKNF